MPSPCIEGILMIVHRLLDLDGPHLDNRSMARAVRRCTDTAQAEPSEIHMRLAQVTVLATLLATAGLSAQAAELRLDDGALDSVSAGLRLPHSPLLQQLPAIMEANGFGQALRTANLGPVLGQLGVLGGLLGGLRLPIGFPGAN
jgi:hypothetical protein